MVGKLIILSGPSGVGKGPLTDTFAVYQKSNNRTFKKHVLYTSRGERVGEKNGVTYHFIKTSAELRKRGTEKGWHVYPVIKKGQAIDFEDNSIQWQAIDFQALQLELIDNDYVLLEIYINEVPEVEKFCKNNGITVKKIFISPFLPEDFESIGCTNEKEREIAMQAAMLTKLINRCTEDISEIKKRAGRAYQEYLDAMNAEFKIFKNPYGEDNAETWRKLQIIYAENKKPETKKEKHLHDIFMNFADELNKNNSL